MPIANLSLLPNSRESDLLDDVIYSLIEDRTLLNAVLSIIPLNWAHDPSWWDHDSDITIKDIAYQFLSKTLMKGDDK